MPEPALSLLFIRPLNKLGWRYLVSGSVAAVLYDVPRMAHAVDFIVSLRMEEIQRLTSLLHVPEFYVPPAEVIADEIARSFNGHFKVIHPGTGFTADFYPAGHDELHGWAFRNARHLQFRGATLAVAPPEYGIIRKLEYFREGGSEKHLRDIRAMLKVSGDLIRHAELEEWIQRRDLKNEWNQVTA